MVLEIWKRWHLKLSGVLWAPRLDMIFVMVEDPNVREGFGRGLGVRATPDEAWRRSRQANTRFMYRGRGARSCVRCSDMPAIDPFVVSFERVIEPGVWHKVPPGTDAQGSAAFAQPGGGFNKLFS